MRVDPSGRIVEFVEKPTDAAILDSLALDEASLRQLGFTAPSGSLLASMGMYVFRRATLSALLAGTTVPDFGRDIIPQSIGTHRVYAHAHNGYWSDIGTIPHFHQANIELALRTRGGTLVYWKTLEGATKEEPSFEEKVSRLRTYRERYGTLDLPPGQILDVREAEGILRKPRSQ